MRQTQLDSAEYYFLKSYQLKKETNELPGLAILNNNLASLYTRKNELDKARNHLHEAYTISSELGLLDELSENYLLRSNYYEKKGDLALSLTSYKNHKVLEDSILNKEKARALTEMQVRFETQQQEEELQAAEFKASVQQKLLSQQRVTILTLSGAALLLMGLILITYKQFLNKKKTANKYDYSCESCIIA